MTSTPAPAMPSSHEQSVEEAIRAAGLRVTAARAAVLSVLRSRPHASADVVLDALDPHSSGFSLQSVYNALNDFTEAGVVRRIHPAGQPMRFETRVNDNHHHLVCTVCGRVEDVDCVVGEAPCLHPADLKGFALAQADVTFWGVCDSCRAQAPSSTHSPPASTVTEGRS